MIETDAILSRRLAKLADSRGDEYKIDKVDHLSRIFDQLKVRCESPIELLLACHVVEMSDGYGAVSFYPALPQMPYVPPWAQGDVGTYFGVQSQLGRYRADLLFRTYGFEDHRWFVVECDGHDYHERTKEQAARDRSRDRSMLAAGIRVMRFTGSEIHRDPQRCADQIGVMLAALHDETMGHRPIST